MPSTRKTSDEFVGATGDYATYTNDVDKPYAQPKAEPVEAPESAKAKNPPEPSEFYGKSKNAEAKVAPSKDDAPKGDASRPAAPKTASK